MTGEVIAVTTPICNPSLSSRGPCSMGSSTEAETLPSGTLVLSRMSCQCDKVRSVKHCCIYTSHQAEVLGVCFHCARQTASLLGPGPRDNEQSCLVAAVSWIQAGSIQSSAQHLHYSFTLNAALNHVHLTKSMHCIMSVAIVLSATCCMLVMQHESACSFCKSSSCSLLAGMLQAMHEVTKVREQASLAKTSTELQCP